MRLQRIGAHRAVRVLQVVLPIVVACLVAVLAWNYSVQLRQPHHGAERPELLPADVAVRTENVSFSRMEGGKTLFTVTAKVNLGFKDKRKVLQDVTVEIFGRDEGSPARRIHSNECSYDERTDDIRFTGNVRLQLDKNTFGRTEELTYNHRDRIIASTTRVHVEQPGVMTGEAGSMEYAMDQGLLRLAGALNMSLAEGARVQAGAGVFQSKENWAAIDGGVHIESSTGWLRGARARADLRPGSFRPVRIVVEGNVSAESHPKGSGETWNLRSDWMETRVSEAGAIEHVLARGGARVQKASGSQSEVLTGGEIEASLNPEGRIQAVEARGNAAIAAGDRTLSSGVIRSDASVVTTHEDSRLQAGDLTIEGKTFTISQGDVVTFSTPFRATIRSGDRRSVADRTRARFDSKSNRLIELVQEGNFQFEEGSLSGRAARATVREDGDAIVLEAPAPAGAAEVSSPNLSLQAKEIRLNQKNRTFEANGGVTTASKGQDERLVIQAAHAKDSGELIVYTGNVRLWRGRVQIDADRIEAPKPPEDGPKDGRDRKQNPPVRFHAAGNVRSRFDAVEVAADALDYSEDQVQQTARYTKNVTAIRTGKQGRTVLKTNDMTVFINNNEVIRAEARGGVDLTQGLRRGVGERADYDPKADEVVLSGDNVEITDLKDGNTFRGTRLLAANGGDIVVLEGDPQRRVTSTHRVKK